MTKTFEDEIVRRIVRSFLDIQILKLIRIEPMWGYAVLKRIAEIFGIEIRHGALYPLLNFLETKDLLKSRREVKNGRMRRVYEITPKGVELLESYHTVLEQQLERTSH